MDTSAKLAAGPLGPTLAAGGISLFNLVIIHGQPVSKGGKIIVGTVVAALALSLVDDAVPGLGTGLAWASLAAVLLVRMNPNVPAPLESLNSWFQRVKS
jgi:hypothetical protein